MADKELGRNNCSVQNDLEQTKVGKSGTKDKSTLV